MAVITLSGHAIMQTIGVFFKNSKGMSLIELMVAIAVTSVIMGIGTTIFLAQSQSFRRSHSGKESLSEVQKGIQLFKEELALAGWSVMPNMAFYIQDGGSNAPDTIFINDINIIDIEDNGSITDNSTNEIRAIVDRECGGCLQYDGVNPPGSLNIDGHGNADDVSGVYVAVWDGDKAYFRAQTNASGQITSVYDGGTIAFGNNYWVAPMIRYCVDLGPDGDVCHPPASPDSMVLRREARDTGGDRQPFVEGVVDVQAVYGTDTTTYGAAGCNATATCQMNPFRASEIEWIDLTIVTRSREATHLKAESVACRPGAANRAAAGSRSAECGYEYRTITTRITPYRNIQ